MPEPTVSSPLSCTVGSSMPCGQRPRVAAARCRRASAIAFCVLGRAAGRRCAPCCAPRRCRRRPGRGCAARRSTRPGAGGRPRAACGRTRPAASWPPRCRRWPAAAGASSAASLRSIWRQELLAQLRQLGPWSRPSATARRPCASSCCTSWLLLLEPGDLMMEGDHQTPRRRVRMQSPAGCASSVVLFRCCRIRPACAGGDSASPPPSAEEKPSAASATT